jgi:hypothetical protein
MRNSEFFPLSLLLLAITLLSAVLLQVADASPAFYNDYNDLNARDNDKHCWGGCRKCFSNREYECVDD